MMNTHRDRYTDAMLRHLGATYYQSLHGKATSAEVASALRSVREGLNGHPGNHSGARGEEPARQPSRRPVRHLGRWRHRVRDVMTTSVVTADRTTRFKDIASLLAEHRISAVPVLGMGRRVVGIVSEADLLKREEPDVRRRLFRASQAGGARRRMRRNAAQLMTSPAITIHPDATLAAAARVMNDHHVRRLPVVGPDGVLIGIVSRRDLVSVYLRPDSEIADEGREVIMRLVGEPSDLDLAVRSGVAFLTGHPEQPDLIPVAARLIADIDGVVAVVDQTTPRQQSSQS